MHYKIAQVIKMQTDYNSDHTQKEVIIIQKNICGSVSTIIIYIIILCKLFNWYHTNIMD
jgi:hypothetical protein